MRDCPRGRFTGGSHRGLKRQADEKRPAGIPASGAFLVLQSQTLRLNSVRLRREARGDRERGVDERDQGFDKPFRFVQAEPRQLRLSPAQLPSSGAPLGLVLHCA